MADRSVLRPPGRAARGLISWALDLWPYVNGKGLASGIRLSEMEAEEMVDLLHFYFEDDTRYSSGEQAEAVSNVRTSLYLLYNKTYTYGVGSKQKVGKSYVDGDYSFSDDPLAAQELKPYVPPTEFNPNSAVPFGSILDAPLG